MYRRMKMDYEKFCVAILQVIKESSTAREQFLKTISEVGDAAQDLYERFLTILVWDVQDKDFFEACEQLEDHPALQDDAIQEQLDLMVHAYNRRILFLQLGAEDALKRVIADQVGELEHEVSELKKRKC